MKRVANIRGCKSLIINTLYSPGMAWLCYACTGRYKQEKIWLPQLEKGSQSWTWNVTKGKRQIPWKFTMEVIHGMSHKKRKLFNNLIIILTACEAGKSWRFEGQFWTKTRHMNHIIHWNISGNMLIHWPFQWICLFAEIFQWISLFTEIPGNRHIHWEFQWIWLFTEISRE